LERRKLLLQIYYKARSNLGRKFGLWSHARCAAAAARFDETQT
jgi:hypothetical protein